MSSFTRAVLGALVACSLTVMPTAPALAAKVDKSKSSQALEKLAPAEGERPTAAIYEVRSAVPGIEARAATEMFMTALIKSGRFRVVERARLAEGVGRERDLMAQGIAQAVPGAEGAITGARYVFEVVISEGNPNAGHSDNAMRIGDVVVARQGNTDEIGMDIRITDVATGEVLDSVNVTEKIHSSIKQVSGLGSLANGLLRRVGKGAIDADAQTSSGHNEGVDQAVRNCIETGVAELARRLSPAA